MGMWAHADLAMGGASGCAILTPEHIQKNREEPPWFGVPPPAWNETEVGTHQFAATDCVELRVQFRGWGPKLQG